MKQQTDKPANSATVNRRKFLMRARAAAITAPCIITSNALAKEGRSAKGDGPNVEEGSREGTDAPGAPEFQGVRWPESGFRSLKVAAISLKVKPWDKQANAAKMEQLFKQAAQRGAEVAVVPEGALEGYVVNEVLQQPEMADRMLEVAEPLDGAYIVRFRRLAKTLRMCLCVGFAERIGNEVFNAVIFIADDGKVCGKYHKMQFAEGTHPSWFFNRIGSTIRAFDTPVGRAGFLICNDVTNPMLLRTLVLDGAQVVYVLTFSGPSEKSTHRLLARCRANGVPIVQANAGGMNLIISKGELIASEFGENRVTVATIDIPLRPHKEAARRLEREFLRWRGPEMEKRYHQAMQNIREGGHPVPVTPPVEL